MSIHFHLNRVAPFFAKENWPCLFIWSNSQCGVFMNILCTNYFFKSYSPFLSLVINLIRVAKIPICTSVHIQETYSPTAVFVVYYLYIIENKCSVFIDIMILYTKNSSLIGAKIIRVWNYSYHVKLSKLLYILHVYLLISLYIVSNILTRISILFFTLFS